MAHVTHTLPCLVVFGLVFWPLLIFESIYFIFFVVLFCLDPLVGLFVLISVVTGPGGLFWPLVGLAGTLVGFVALCLGCRPFLVQ